METDSHSVNIAQLTLFDLGESSSGAVELFPSVWSAAEALVSPDSATRRMGLEKLVEIGAPRLSPLVAYLLATRLTDPDLETRAGAVRVLGEVLAADREGLPAPTVVRQHLTAFLAQMRTRTVYALVQVVAFDPGLEPQAAALLNACPFAGRHLVDILADRRAPLPIRKLAADFVGLVGYLDALPALERLESRLVSRLNGQQAMPFASPYAATPAESDETDLLPAVQEALALLRLP